jgi:hypothetical protein
VWELDDGDGGADVCAEGWVHPHIVGNITIVTLGVGEGC